MEGVGLLAKVCCEDVVALFANGSACSADVRGALLVEEAAAAPSAAAIIKVAIALGHNIPRGRATETRSWSSTRTNELRQPVRLQLLSSIQLAYLRLR